jgi:hypothetical protein
MQNPKLEIRNPKQIQIPKSECPKTTRAHIVGETHAGLVGLVLSPWYLNFGIVSDFVLRISNLKDARTICVCHN